MSDTVEQSSERGFYERLADDEVTRDEKVQEAVRLAKPVEDGGEGLNYIEVGRRLGVQPPTASAYLREGRGRSGRRGFPRGPETPSRMSIRIDQKLFNRFDKALDRERRKDPAVTQRSLVEQSLRMYLDEHHPTRQQQREAGSNGRNDSAATGAAAS